MSRGSILMLLLSAALTAGPSAQRGAAQSPVKGTGGPALSHRWSGKLFDAPCKRTKPSERCEVAENTKEFGIETPNGSIFVVDQEGNAKIRAALRDAGIKSGDVSVSIVEVVYENTIKVESVQIVQ